MARDAQAGTTTITCPGSEPVVIADGQDGQDGAPCTVERDEEAATTTISCPGSPPVVLTDGEGAGACTIEREEGTVTITCPGSPPVTIRDGRDGEDATPCALERDEEAGTLTVTCPGSPPVTLRDGEAGQDAQPCAIERDDEAGTTTITCPGSPPVVLQDGEDGRDGAPCGVERDDEAGTTTITCPGSPPVVIGDPEAAPAEPAFVVELNAPFDLETGSSMAPDPDIVFEQPDPEQPIELRPAQPGVELARLVPATYEALSIEDLARARFSEDAVEPVELVEQEQGEVVLLVRSAEGRLYKLGRLRALPEERIGFDYATLPFDLPPLRAGEFEPTDLELGRFNPENPGLNDLRFRIEDPVLGRVEVEPAAPGVRLARRTPARFGAGTAVDFTALAEGPQPLYAAEGEAEGVVIVQTAEGNYFELGRAWIIGDDQIAIEAARLQVEEPDLLVELGEPVDLDTGRGQAPAELADLRFEFQARLTTVRAEPGTRLALVETASPELLDEGALADLEFEESIDFADPQGGLPDAILARTGDRVFVLSAFAVYGSGATARLGLNLDLLPAELPEVEVPYQEAFDLETLSAQGEGSDLSIEPAGPGLGPRLRPSPGSEVARLSPAFYPLVGPQAVAAAVFGPGEVSLTPDPQAGEAGPVVLLIRTAEGNVFKIEPGFATSALTYGFDLDLIPPL